MKIDGRALARDILDSLKDEVAKLVEQGVTPTLAVVLVGDNPASISYIKQKQIAAEAIGAKIVMSQQTTAIGSMQMKEIIHAYNTDPTVHGIIVQRPLPKETHIDPSVLLTVGAAKDVDGFVSGSPFVAPVALAVEKILDTADKNWQKQHIVIVGRGETAGKPIYDYLMKPGCQIAQIHSQTPNPEALLKEADIIISCVGHRGVVTKSVVKPGAILIGVGIGRDEEAVLQGDYDEAEIADVASFYTPTPGGVGPINVACLMANLVVAAKTH